MTPPPGLAAHPAVVVGKCTGTGEGESRRWIWSRVCCLCAMLRMLLRSGANGFIADDERAAGRMHALVGFEATAH